MPPTNGEDSTLVYLTGAEAGVDSESLAALARETAAPQRIVAEAIAGAATVYVRANRGSVPDRPNRRAASVAAAVHRLTTEIWPAETVHVIVDIHVMPDDAVFSLVLDIFGVAQTISADSPRGLRLLSLCREVSADPWRLESWFAQLRDPSGRPRARRKRRRPRAAPHACPTP